MSSGRSTVLEAELSVGNAFGVTWSRPVCLRALFADGSRLSLSDLDNRVLREDRCEQGQVVANWQAPSKESSPARSANMEYLNEQSGALASWRALLREPSYADPNSVRAISEYFPLGHAAETTQSFLRLQLQAADRHGDEVLVLREGGQTSLCRPVRWLPWLSRLARFEAPSLQSIAGLRVASGEWGDQHAACTLPSVQKTVLDATDQGFLDETWQGRVCAVEEHCRPANLGLWGWLFRLQHSVLAVRVRGSGDDEECYYLDKNLDLGVCLRRADRGETFGEAPREGYAWRTDMSLQELWQAVIVTRSFTEDQQTSNCQHFVKEVIEELAARGKLPAANPSLRNQAVADVLRDWGYLGPDCKPIGGRAAQAVFGAVTSAGSSAGAMVQMSSWAARFTLEPAERIEVE